MTELFFLDKKYRIFLKGLANSSDLPYVTQTEN
ncbi:hypothetical protein ME9_01387 [Bartonella taylorii 8TBB]|uniref:Uncharacterized protein n=1 Tax=Bartonella taylorii 8TBB TaxID=1094560 RepID=A0A9P2RXU4_BARTA|nr:hypothetical protein ME9_01387 [Bartonella taylorii 8TBB]OPB34985.1 hypothetical protein Btaycd_009700 [Bartonella taylorii]